MTISTFELPAIVEGTVTDQSLGRRLIAAWQAEGILQIRADHAQSAATDRALAASRAFFSRPLAEKAAHVSAGVCFNSPPWAWG